LKSFIPAIAIWQDCIETGGVRGADDLLVAIYGRRGTQSTATISITTGDPVAVMGFGAALTGSAGGKMVSYIASFSN